MTLFNVIKLLKELSLKHPNIGSAEEGSIYDIMNSSKEHKYATVVITQGTHSDDETYDYYNLNLFYVDRLVSDMESNRLEIQSLGKSMLQNIIKAFCDEFDAESERIEYHPFTEKFADECSGVYATLTISIVKDYNCNERYWDEDWVAPIVTIRNQSKNVEYTENGTYLVEYDADKYSGLEKVEITVNVPDTNGSYDDGYDNGYEEGYNEGHEEGEELGIAVQKQKLTSLSVTKNGTYNREDGYNSVDVNIDIKINLVENGIKLAYSFFSKVPEWVDFEGIIDTSYLFSNCSKLTTVPLFDTSEVETMSNMFYSCLELIEIPQFNTSKVTNMESFCGYCSKLTTFPQLDTSNVTNMSRLFYGCSKLTSVPPLNASKLTTVTAIMGYSKLNALTDFGGLIGLKTSITSYCFDNTPNLTYESCINILNGLYDFVGNNETPTSSQGKLKISQSFMDKLSEEDLQIAIGKGWQLLV